MRRFSDRVDAGRQLARALEAYAGRANVIVLALPRGGVPVGYEVARALNVPLDIFVVRKLGVPGHEELALGAIAVGGIRVFNRDVIRSLGISEAVIDQISRREQQELERRARAYRGDRPGPVLTGRQVILVDDGLATGASMRAAVAAVRAARPARLIVAVPVAAPDTCELLRGEVDETVCLATPEPFFGVGYWYDDFGQMTDNEVNAIFADAAHVLPAAHAEDEA